MEKAVDYRSVNGNNNLQQVCGYIFDADRQEHGFIGTLPFQRNTH
jgi:hypothetical protein